MDGKLNLIENENAVWVFWADDPDDWIVCFQKTAQFPARAWAERMLALDNLDLSPQPTLQVVSRVRLENYHPDPSSL
jgi:hypothetical protein